MKKVLFILVCILVLFTICGCNSSDFIGTYTRETSWNHKIVCPEGTGTWLNSSSPEGVNTLVIENGGKGRFYFTANNGAYYGENFILYDGEITWEVVDEYLYVEGTLYAQDESGESYELNREFKLEGKTLVDAGTPEIRYNRK